MRRTLAVIVLSGLFVGCPGGGGSGGSGGSGSGGPIVLSFGAGTNPSGIQPATPRFAFASNDDTTVSLYTVNASTGLLRNNGYTVVGTSATNSPGQVVVHPTGQFVYVPNQADNTVSAYTMTSSGVLANIPGSPFATGNTPAAATMDRSGKFLYVANAFGNTISAYTINQGTGVLTSIGAVVPTGMLPVTLVIDPSSQFLYVANASSNTVSAFTINAGTGALAQVPGSPFVAGLGTDGLAIDPKGRVLFVTDFFQNTVTAFTINAVTGTLTNAVVFGVGSNPSDVTMDLSGQFLYVTNQGSNNISAFAINAATGLVTAIPGSPFEADLGPTALLADPSGKFLYVMNGDANTTSIFNIDPVTGVLTSSNSIRTRTSPQALAMSTGATAVTYTPTYYYAIDAAGMRAFSIDAATGVLTSVAGSPFAIGMNGSQAVDPKGRFIFVTDPGANGVLAFSVNNATGVLTAVPGSPFAAGLTPIQGAEDPSGRFLYVVNEGGVFNISAYTIDQSSGVLTPIPGSPFPITVIGNSFRVTVDPTGQFLYLGSNTFPPLTVYKIDPITGALAVGSSAGQPAPAPNALMVEPTGKLGFFTDSGLSIFSINALSGQPTIVQNSGNSPLLGQGAMSANVSGRVLFVPGGSPNVVYTYGINPTSGMLTALPGSPYPLTGIPMAATLDPSEKFLYVPLSAGPILLYGVDTNTGALTANGTVATGSILSGPVSIMAVIQ